METNDATPERIKIQAPSWWIRMGTKNIAKQNKDRKNKDIWKASRIKFFFNASLAQKAMPKTSKKGQLTNISELRK